MIVLEYNGVGPAVKINGGRVVPAETEGIQEIAVGTEVHHVSLGPVVRGVSSVENAAVRRYHGRGGRIIQHATRRRLVGSRVNAESRTSGASAVCASAAGIANGEAHAGAFIEPAAE